MHSVVVLSDVVWFLGHSLWIACSWFPWSYPMFDLKTSILSVQGFLAWMYELTLSAWPFEEGWPGEHLMCLTSFSFRNWLNSSDWNCGPLSAASCASSGWGFPPPPPPPQKPGIWFVAFLCWWCTGNFSVSVCKFGRLSWDDLIDLAENWWDIQWVAKLLPLVKNVKKKNMILKID